MSAMPGAGLVRRGRPGVERLEQEAAALFPGSRILVLSSDLVESVERLRQELDDVAAGRFDIVVGTQLVAKGHHFPKLNLVGIVDADLGLSNGDPRAAERTFQLLHQVVGRAGREAGPGHRLSAGTHQPEHPVMRAMIAADRDAFYTSEIELREKTQYPPFGRLASILISAGERHAAEGYARRLAALAPRDGAGARAGPAEAPLAVVRGRHRFRLLVKSPRDLDLSAYLRDWLAAAPKHKGDIKLEVDSIRHRPAELSVAGRCSAARDGRKLPVRRTGVLRLHADADHTFAAPHFALRFWLIVAAAPSLQITEAIISSTLHVSVSPLSWTRRMLATAVWQPVRTRHGRPSVLGDPRGRSDRVYPVCRRRHAGPALLWALRAGRADLSGRTLRPFEATGQQQQRGKRDEQSKPSHDRLPMNLNELVGGTYNRQALPRRGFGCGGSSTVPGADDDVGRFGPVTDRRAVPLRAG